VGDVSLKSIEAVQSAEADAAHRTRVWLSVWFGALVLIGLLNALHRYLNNIAVRIPALFGFNLIEEMTGSLSFGVMLPVLIAALRRIREVKGRLARYGCHLLVLVVLSILHTSLMWGSRVALFQLFGLGHYDYGVMPWRYLMEFPSDVFYYLLVAVVLWLFDRYRQAQQQELRAVQLESALSEARLDALRLQLNPHFLFNTLNAISSIMYEQPRVADEMLARIGDLLRATLGAKEQEHALLEEWRLLGLYLDIQRARFDQQLTVDIDADASLNGTQVPFLVLQPLVENAIEHAGGETRRVEIKASRSGERVEFCVYNNSAPAGRITHHGHGIGLSNIEARLRHLYGDRAGLRLEPEGQDGSRVWLWLPLHEGQTA
jgi:two-component system, LytTR family, sensor kinase